MCLIHAINNDFSINKVASNFVKFYKSALFTPHGEVFDIGNATRSAIEKMDSGMNPLECGGRSDIDNGNGSLMRVLPIAFYGENMNEIELIKLIEEISSLTHAHNRSKLACIFYVVYAIQLMNGYGKIDAYNKTIKFIDDKCRENYLDEFKNFKDILEKKCIEYTSHQIKSTGYVIDTLEAALWAFCNADSYKKTVLDAVNLGGDTDTIAAIAGGLAGIYYGYRNIPNSWVQNISRKEELHQMFSEFIDVLGY